MATGNARPEGFPTRLEIACVMLVCAAITAYTYSVAHHADINTPPDPAFRELVHWTKSKGEYLYGPFQFQCLVLIFLGALLLPDRLRDKWSVMDSKTPLQSFYFIILWFLLVLGGGSLNASRALNSERNFFPSPAVGGRFDGNWAGAAPEADGCGAVAIRLSIIASEIAGTVTVNHGADTPSRYVVNRETVMRDGSAQLSLGAARRASARFYVDHFTGIFDFAGTVDSVCGRRVVTGHRVR